MYEHLSDLAQRLGRYMAENCFDGLAGHFGDDLLSGFPEESRERVASALAELEADGLVTLSHVLGPHLPRVRTTVELFVASDPAITGYDPVDDSAALASILIEKPQLAANAQNLEEATGWERRRFNPAFALLIPCIRDGHVRKPIQNNYPVMGMMLGNDDLVELRRYVRQHLG